MTVQLDPCPVCGFAAWPEGGMHAARAIHMREHERKGETADSWVDPGRDTAKYPQAPRVFRDKPARSSAPLTWPAVVLVAVVGLTFVACVWAVVWGFRG